MPAITKLVKVLKISNMIGITPLPKERLRTQLQGTSLCDRWSFNNRGPKRSRSPNCPVVASLSTYCGAVRRCQRDRAISGTRTFCARVASPGAPSLHSHADPAQRAQSNARLMRETRQGEFLQELGRAIPQITSCAKFVPRIFIKNYLTNYSEE